MLNQQPNQNYDFTLVGIDTETGGLTGPLKEFSYERNGEDVYPLLEIAIVLPEVSEFGLLKVTQDRAYVVGIQPTEKELNDMSPWAKKQHEKSGLLERLKTGQGFDVLVSNVHDAEEVILAWLERKEAKPYDKETKSGCIPYGNNVGFDLRFIEAKMPRLHAFFHYRKIDVSTINVLSRTVWSGLNIRKPVKELNHTALADILESTDELNLYTQSMCEAYL